MTTRELFPHQHRGADFAAARPVAGLFMGMGTGKTLTSLEAARRVSADRIVVVGPPISLPMWKQEATDWLHLNPDLVSILKTGKQKIGSERVIVVSYAIAAKRAEELGEWLAAGHCSVVIFDESHALKNVSAKRTTALIGKGGMTDATCDHIWFLTGTPITRWNDDLYPFFARADKNGMRERCGGVNVSRFRSRYTVQQQKQYSKRMRPAWVTISNRNTQELAEWTYGDAAMRVDLDEVYKDMPPLTTNAYNVDLDSDAELRSMLKDVEKMTVAEIKEQAKKSPELATLRRRLGMAKVKAASKEITERIESGQNVLVGAWHTDVIDELVEKLSAAGYVVGVIDGRAGSSTKSRLQEQWNAGEINALICQIGAAGVSLNLQQGGSQIVVVEEDWSPTIMDQFYARLWRYGQQKHVHVDILRSDTKLDKALAKVASAKAAQAEKHNQIGRDMAARTEETYDG